LPNVVNTTPISGALPIATAHLLHVDDIVVLVVPRPHLCFPADEKRPERHSTEKDEAEE